MALGNASLFAIDEFNLPVTNAVAGLSQNQFFCSGSLLRVEINDPNHPVDAGLPLTPAVMFERNPVFDTRPTFRGRGAGQLSQGSQSAAQRLLAGRRPHPG